MPDHAPAWLTVDGAVDDVLGLLKTGKEAEVFLVERRSPDGEQRALLAHKRYRPVTVSHKGELEALGFTKARTFTNDARYRVGRARHRSGRDQRAVEAKTGRGRGLLAAAWLDEEHANLQRAHAGGVTVPYPVERTADGILMQLVGDEEGAAPRLVQARLSDVELSGAFEQLEDELRRLLQAGLVHADLSPFNVLWWRERLWLIDLPQAVDVDLHPGALDLLHHDVVTMCTWFTRHGVARDPEALFAALL